MHDNLDQDNVEGNKKYDNDKGVITVIIINITIIVYMKRMII